MKLQLKVKSDRFKGVSLEQKTSPVLVRSQIDRWSAYCANRVPVAQITRKLVGMPIPSRLVKHGYLLTQGDKPGMLIRSVRHDKQHNFYRIVDSLLFGSVAALNSAEGHDLKAQIVSKDNLLALAKKINRAYSVRRISSGEYVKVWLLTGIGDQYVAAITVRKGKLVPVNIEWVEPHNKKDVQFDDPKALKLDFDEFFASVR